MKKNINFIKIIFCIAILLYHLGLLSGGFLATASFFAISGYLSITSAYKKFSLKEYYLKRLKRIYLPLIIVVFFFITIISFMSSINYINLKPEVTSILLGYNNYFQINVGEDYFIRNNNLAFLHLWYIAILIQFDLIFPFIFMVIKKLDKKSIPVLLIISIITSVFILITPNITLAYYDTLTRIFSIFFGMFLGVLNHYNYTLKLDILNKYDKYIFSFYLIINILLFIFVKSNYIGIYLILETLITLKLIDYDINMFDSKLSIYTYEIYLIHYPLIFIFSYISMNNYLKIIIIVILTLVLSVLLHYLMNLKNKVYKIFIIMILITYGIYLYIITKDHTEEMNALKNQLVSNEIIMQEKQKEYLNKLMEDENNWQNTLDNLNDYESNLNDIVKNIRITGIGDSIMLGAVNTLYDMFPNGYFDAYKSRTDYEVYPILSRLINNGMLGDVILFNLGTNGECPIKCKEAYLSLIKDKIIFWANATKPDYASFNPNLVKLSQNYSNIKIIDWVGASSGHPEYFIADGIHLTDVGKIAYANTVYNSIYNYYLEEHHKKIDNMLKEHDEKEKNKISFIGNDIFLNAYEIIHNKYPNASYYLDKYTYNSLIKTIENNTLSYNIVLGFDKTLSLTKEDYLNIIHKLDNHMIYIISLDNLDIDSNFVKVININLNDEDLMVDKIHLTNEANNKLLEIINSEVGES